MRQILERIAGTGGEEAVLAYEVEDPSQLAAFAEGLAIGPEAMAADGSAYLGAVDGPHLVGFASIDPAGDRYVDDYLALQARNSYASYRTRSLWATVPSVLAHPDLDWVRRFLPKVVAAALAPAPSHFDEQVPITVAALDVAAGEAGAPAAWASWRADSVAVAKTIAGTRPGRAELQRGAGDRWSRHRSRLCALAEAEAVGLGDRASARSLLELAARLPYGFAGFESPACLTLAEAAHIDPGDRGPVGDALDRAGTPAHCCQDPSFCARTTSRFNALALRWWRRSEPAPPPLDLEAVIGRLRSDPGTPEFSAVHVVGEGYTGRLAPPLHLPFPDRAERADRLVDLAWLYERPLDAFPRLNRHLGAGPDDTLAPGSSVNVPDDDLAPQVATFLSAQVLAAGGGAGAARQIQSLIPVAVGDRTATDTLVARMLLAVPPTSASVRARLPRALPEVDPPEPLTAEVS